jgi:hypothetical protein
MTLSRIGGLALVVLFATAGSARATDFTLNGYGVSYNTDGDHGLGLWVTNLLGDADKNFSLSTAGQTETVSLFRLGTKETALNSDDWVQYPISVSFQLTPPGIMQTVEGLTGAAWFFGSFGYAVWDNPVMIAFGSSGLLGVTLSPVAFGLPGSAVIDATFTLVRADNTTSVPEPTALALLGVGAAMAASRARRKRAQTKSGSN